MGETYNEMHRETGVKTQIIIQQYLNAYNTAASKDPPHLHDALMHALRQIAQQFTTNEYSFNLAIDLFVEKTSHCIEETLQYILELHIPNRYPHFFDHPDCDALFCAYYALSLIYKKKDHIEDLITLLDNFGEENERYSKFEIFSKYPLYYEVLSRCYKRLKKLKIALEQDQFALNLLKGKHVDNVAIGNSYASTVSMMLASNIRVSRQQLKNAHEYIEKAIRYNPDYPKYYFVKAKLLYYSARQESMDVYRFEEICNEAIALVEEKARIALHNMYEGSSEHRKTENQKYSDLRIEIEAELERRLDAAHEEASTCKEEILRSTEYMECPRPKMPELDDGKPYFYICYSTMDYKSVFCDMVELYHHRIPFKYDECLTAGQAWNPQVESTIRNKQCKGVVFYISKNTLISESFCHEIEMVCEKMKKPYFAVNLEGSEAPSRILIDTILEVCRKGKKYPISGDQIRPFVRAFPDKMVFAQKSRRNGDSGTKHFGNYKKQLKKQFGMDL